MLHCQNLTLQQTDIFHLNFRVITASRLDTYKTTNSWFSFGRLWFTVVLLCKYVFEKFIENCGCIPENGTNPGVFMFIFCCSTLLYTYE